MSTFAKPPLKCCRCRRQLKSSQLVTTPRRKIGQGVTVSDRVCPSCGCKSFYDITPTLAWCWRSGLIEVGAKLPRDDADGGGAILVASGPKYALEGRLQVLARHGQGKSEGKLLVPGVPEAESASDAADALDKWLEWCASRPPRDGVVFNTKKREAPHA
ncbi:hypothetical protein [uncultured Pseudacidovorax sp.]|uniref:hypothetical protein n=1 Tax=uncultured Pseudacidovorax sp. TaxID=679313 RepID=UPI0025E532BD|nr:hypothetical protein [uncultured Pseudacidovorax sp.]